MGGGEMCCFNGLTLDLLLIFSNVPIIGAKYVHFQQISQIQDNVPIIRTCDNDGLKYCNKHQSS